MPATTTTTNKSSGKPINMHILLVKPSTHTHTEFIGFGENKYIDFVCLCAFIITAHSLTIFGFDLPVSKWKFTHTKKKNGKQIK